MIWREPKNHSDERYFNEKNEKKCKSIDYSSPHSTIWLVWHLDELVIPVFHDNLLKLVESEKSDTDVNERHSGNYPNCSQDFVRAVKPKCTE